MSYNYSNYTQFGIKNDAEKYSYIVWGIFVVLCSLVCDTCILVASIKYRAFNLHKIVVAFIQHLAVCDLVVALGHVLPSCVSLIYNNGGSSEILKYVRFLVSYYGNYVCASLTAAMALSKLLLLKFPLRAPSWSKRQAHNVCIGIWITLISVPALLLLVIKDSVIFDYRVYIYRYKYSSGIWNILLPIVTLMLLGAPNIVIIVSTILLLKEAKKVVRRTQETLRWQGIMTVVLTAAVYSLSILPFVGYYVAEPFIEKDPFVPGKFHVEYFRLASAFTAINILANFFVYSVTVASFRKFLKTTFQTTVAFLSYKDSSQGNNQPLQIFQ